MFLPKSKFREEYIKHLKSQYWYEFRKSNLKNHCQSCGSKYRLDLHHLTYAHFGNEKQYPKDVISLCRSCHDRVHFNAWGWRRKNWRVYSTNITKPRSVHIDTIILIVLLILTVLSFLLWKSGLY
jgi:5-methylcytosine-specific restriction endonuclease McrA